jgi:peptidoglycan L-alanyl-D-glutamate endopeptidase CwlK
MSRLIEDLQDDFERVARHFLLRCHDEGLSVSVTSTRRTREEQIAYYSQGRGTLGLVNILRDIAGFKPIKEDANRIISYTDGHKYKSRHQSGMAFDIVILDKFGAPVWDIMKADYEKIGELAKECGLEWGGNWTPKDAFHLEA